MRNVPAPRARRVPVTLVIVAFTSLLLVQCGEAAARRCFDALPHSTTLLDRQWTQRGGSTVTIPLPPVETRDLLVALREHGVDVELEAVDANGSVILHADHPVEREGTQYAYRTAAAPFPTALVVRAKEPAGFIGSVHLLLSTVAAEPAARPSAAETCRQFLQSMSAADASYQRGRAIELHGTAAIGDSGSARTAFESALRSYQAALQSLEGTPFPSDRGEVQLASAALSYYELQDWAGSAAWAARAAESFATSGDLYLRARAQAIMAAAWLEMATRSTTVTPRSTVPADARALLDEARALLMRLARFHSARRERYDEILQVDNIGVAYIYEARFERAIPYLTRAQTAFEKLGDTARAAIALQNLAICRWGLGQLSAAVPEFDRALGMMRPSPYPDLYLLTLNNSGLAHYAAGQLDASLRLQAQALDFATLSQSERARARSFYGMGVVYYAIGDRALAEQFLHRALDIATAELDARVRVATLRATAVVEHEERRIPQAIEHDSEALALATAPSARSRILLRLAEDQAALGERSAAMELLSELIAHPPERDRLVRATALVQRGALRRAAGDLRGAETDLKQGLHTLAAFESLAERFEGEVELAHVFAQQDRAELALATLRDALRLSPEIRAETSNPEYRASIVQSLRPAVEFEIELLRKRYEQQVARHDGAAATRVAVEALRVADESRAQVFESWRAELPVRGIDARTARLMAARDGLYRDMAERRFQLSTREDRGGAADPRARLLREELARLRVRLGLINSELATEATTGIPTRPHSGSDWTAQLAHLQPGHALVEYWLGSERAYAWTASDKDLAWIALAPSREIDQSARTLHHMMQTGNDASSAQRLSQCALLHQLLLAPLGALRTARVVTIVPDGALHYVPFAALRDEARHDDPYLVQRVVISIAPALRLVTAPSPHRSGDFGAQPTRLLLVADPVYGSDDPRVLLARTAPAAGAAGAIHGSLPSPVGTEALARLPSTAREAEHIRAQFAPADVDLLEGLDATRDALLARDLGSYRFIHIASHGVMDAEIPELSALVLGKFARQGLEADAYVRAGDLLTRVFNSQAVVLSACDTALGKEYASEGLIGLRYAALARGAHSVVASLWAIADGIAADLMTSLYEQIRADDAIASREPAAPQSEIVAAALTAAMRHVLQQTPSLDPALWAAFSVYVAGD